VPFVVNGSSFLADHNFIVNSSAVLHIYNSSFTIGNNLYIYGSTLQISDTVNISISSSLILSNASLEIHLSDLNIQQLIKTGKLQIVVANYESVEGNFDKLSILNSSQIPGCVSVTGNPEALMYTVLVSLDCPETISTNWQLVEAIVLICTIVPTFIGAIAWVTLKRHRRQIELRRIKSKQNKQEPSSTITYVPPFLE